MPCNRREWQPVALRKVDDAVAGVFVIQRQQVHPRAQKHGGGVLPGLPVVEYLRKPWLLHAALARASAKQPPARERHRCHRRYLYRSARYAFADLPGGLLRRGLLILGSLSTSPLLCYIGK